MTSETVRDRLEHLKTEVGPLELVAGAAFAASLLFTLAFMQEPLVHDSLHGFRHGAGVTCH